MVEERSGFGGIRHGYSIATSQYSLPTRVSRHINDQEKCLCDPEMQINLMTMGHCGNLR